VQIKGMKKLLITPAVAACLLPLVGQEAKVVVVEKTDSARLAKAYKNYQDALKEWERAKVEVADHYLNEPCTVTGSATGIWSNGFFIPDSTQTGGKKSTCRRSGWENIQFSTDFRAIVPEVNSHSTRGTLPLFGSGTTMLSAPTCTGTNCIISSK
jgi:hypothetical protein